VLKILTMMMMAFITINSGLVPLIELIDVAFITP